MSKDGKSKDGCKMSPKVMHVTLKQGVSSYVCKWFEYRVFGFQFK